MSLHFEVVLTCFLRDDTPNRVLRGLRWHMGTEDERPAELLVEAHPRPLLTTDPDSRLPGGEWASLCRQQRGMAPSGPHHAWGLFTRTYWLDDDMGELATLLDWIAPHVEENGYGGYVREELETEPTAVVFRAGGYDLIAG